MSQPFRELDFGICSVPSSGVNAGVRVGQSDLGHGTFPHAYHVPKKNLSQKQDFIYVPHAGPRRSMKSFA